MRPVIVLVGRSNVGKSTLFNRLTRTNDALVADFIGLTRDRKYGNAKWRGYEFIIIDTAGIDFINEIVEGVKSYTEKQSLLAIQEADIVLFILDGRVGLMPSDIEIAKYLRNYQKQTILVVNKTDGIDANIICGEFCCLGIWEMIPIAASKNRGINRLWEKVLLLLVQQSTVELKCYKDSQRAITLPIKLAIVGGPNVGKSTLINRILGQERVVVCDMPGTTRESIYIPMMQDERQYVLIDTAGMLKRSHITMLVEKYSVRKTLQAIKDANVVLLVIDASKGISYQDLSLISFVINSGRSLVIAINKWDCISTPVRYEFKKMVAKRLEFIYFTRVHFISALKGSGIFHLFQSVQEAYQCSTSRIGTAKLTKIMRQAVEEHQPPLLRGHRIKPKYAHMVGYNPPIVIIHGSQVQNLPESYKQYLMNYLRNALDIIGTPIRMRFNDTVNPFSVRRNMTPQRRKR